MALAGAAALALTGCQTTSSTQASGSGGTGSEFDDASGGSGGADTGSSMIGALKPIYFDYDRAEIRYDQRETLKTNATAIKGNSGWGTVTIEGHCDERGSEEYNLALGDRRAGQVRSYMVDLGVSSSRLRTVSFGEAKPAVPGHDESAWRYNRRADFSN